MNPFFNYLLQTAIALAVFYMLYWFLLRKETFFQINRFYFLAGAIFCLILPAINRAFLPVAHEIPVIRVIHDGYEYLNKTFTLDPVTVSQGKSILFSWHGVVLILYLTGVILLAARLFYQTGFLIHEIRKYGVRKISGMKVVVSKQIQSPFSFFSYIFLHPSQINESNLSNIILHEKEHIRQRHSIDLFVVECLSVFQWFNPFVWFYRRSVKETHEFLADRTVIRQGISLQNYQNLLLRFSLGHTYMGLIHTFNYSLGKKRMIMMKKRKSPNRRKWRMLFLIPVLVLLNLAFSNPFPGGSAFEDQKGSTESHLVKGKVTAEDTGKSLPGVSVIIKDTNTGTITDKSGEFVLEIEEENIMLSVSFIGYESLMVKAKKGEFLNIVLKRKTDKKKLDYPEKKHVTELSSIDAAIYNAALYIIDGKEVIKEEADKYLRDSDIIQSISVLKGETAVEKYGEKGKNGVIIFTTKDYISINSPGNLNSNENKELSSLYQDKTLYFVSEKEITNKEFRQLNPDNIQSVNVLKGENAVKNYGERARDGVIIVTLKDYISSNSDKKYFVKGKVLYDGTGEPLPGASVIIMSTTIGTISDLNGEFSLQVDKEKVWLAISYVGYETLKVWAKDGEYLNIRLKRGVYKIDLDQQELKDNNKPLQPDKPTKRSQGKIFFVVEDVPHFPGGIQALSEYISSNILYPKKALKKKISGKVMVRFLVDKQGNIKDVAIEKGVDSLLDQEALRVVSNMPKWKPGEQRGKPVGVTLSVPVEFKLK